MQIDSRLDEDVTKHIKLLIKDIVKFILCRISGLCMNHSGGDFPKPHLFFCSACINITNNQSIGGERENFNRSLRGKFTNHIGIINVV